MKEDKIQIKGISVNVRRGIWVSCLLVSVVFLGLMVSTNAVGNVTCTNPPSNLVSWWPGDGNAFDIENGNDGTFNGTPVYGTGKVGSAFSFDGNIANFVSVPTDASLDLTQFTVDAWIYPTTSSGTQWIIGKEGPNGINYILALTDDHRVEVDFNPGNHQFVDSTDPVPMNAWSHIAGTYDGTTLKLYINGVLNGTPLVSGQTPPVGQPITIGIRNNNTFPFQGLIDEVEVSNRALSQREIRAIVKAGSAGKCRTCTSPPSGMISWWPGNRNAFDIQDGNDGTPQGGVTFAAGKVSQAFSFDGVNDYVALPDIPALNFGTGDFTVDFWGSSASSDRMDPVSFGQTLSSNNLDFDFNDSGFGLWVYWNSGGANAIQVGSTGDYTDGLWHHFALTRNGTTFTLYIDGSVAGSTSYSGVVDLSNTTHNTIGARTTSGTPDLFWNGMIDEVEVFNRALSQADIQAIVNAGSAGKCVNWRQLLRLYHKLKRK